MGQSPRDKDGFTARERLFLSEYMVSLNGKDAAARAGYSTKSDSAKSQAAKLLKRPHIRAALAEAMKLRAERLEVSADRVVQELAKIGFAPFGDINVSIGEKRAALDSLARHLGLYKDKVDLGGDLKTELRIRFV